MSEISAQIGPTFAAECEAAGLAGLPFSFSADTVFIGPDMPEAALARLTKVIAEHHPLTAAPAPVVVVAKVELYRRMTEDEFTRMQAGVEQQSPRIQGIFSAAVNFRSDAPEWQLLVQMGLQLFGADRTAELLVPSE